MEFSKLRLSGFKSFADPTELIIEPGLTGVVGPNGCGKSNLLEALRWVMGENSYKSMRGSGMEDVIFAGSSNRPSRNMAEVTVFLGNEARTAPAAFNDADQLEITRRIEHEAGSAYRINGKDVRARDVQLLFADASTGSRSPALVRQGQIGEIISAKPAARRRILEEAAGITGLHTRRHEAQLRLNGAETNLTRLEDVMGQLESQLGSLKRQARQAKRYKKIAGEIRKAEAVLLYLRWIEAAEASADALKQLEDDRRELGGRTQAAAQALRMQNEAAEALPDLRERETIAAAALQRLSVESDRLEMEEKRAQARMNELETRQKQTSGDQSRERENIEETQRFLEKLASEEKELIAADSDTAQSAKAAEEKLKQASTTLQESEKVLDDASQSIAQLKARQAALERSKSEQIQKLEQLTQRLGTTEAELAQAEQENVTAQDETAAQDLGNAEQSVAANEQAVAAAEQAVRQARTGESSAREDFDAKNLKVQQLQTEIRTLTKVLNVRENDLWPPVIDAVTVKAGWEAAFGAALGDDLDVPLDDAAPVHWDRLPDYDTDGTLPDGVTPLSDLVQAPDALKRRLSMIGIVEAGDGKRMQPDLKPGQRLVSRDGDLWRWDGYTAAADAPTAAAQRLAERNRLSELEGQLSGLQSGADQARTVLESASETLQKAQTAETEQRAAWRQAIDVLEQVRADQMTHERKRHENATRLTALKDTHERLTGELKEARAQLETALGELETLAASMPAESDLDELRRIVGEHRVALSQARADHDGRAHERRLRQARLDTISSERQSWAARAEKSQSHIATLEARLEELQTEITKLQALPGTIAEQRKTLLDALGDKEKTRNDAADLLAKAETSLKERTGEARASEAALAETREAVARMEARLEAARERETETIGAISESLNLKPEEVPASAEFDAEGDLPSAEETEVRLDKWRAERERLGAVNLRAEQEAEELTEEFEHLGRERDDLVQAISKLRQGISSLNKEGRIRLLEAFETVNSNFERLFTHLFGGGAARLELIEADDPLEAGLEIMARPPGKRLQSLSLLSGGEQALTAMALIFAVFLTNPSPICVLDEVDAPLDDANVQRFCNLLEEMQRTTDTRYLIITHHALTMSRMSRLFGVTMGERGVSQLVSVDLETAEQYREAG